MERGLLYSARERISCDGDIDCEGISDEKNL